MVFKSFITISAYLCGMLGIIYYVQPSADRYMLAVLIALVMMVVLVYAVAIYYMRRKEKMIVNSQTEIVRRTMCLDDANERLKSVEKLLEDTQDKLEEKRRQSQSLLQMLHHSEMQENATDIVAKVRMAAEGKTKINDEDWKELFYAINSVYPDFADMLISRTTSLNEQQMQVCYLMRIGMSNPQIRNVTDLPRTTIWRWTKTYAWIYEVK